MESPTMRESMREGSKASSKSMGYMSVAEEAGESILSDIQAVLVGNAELRKELQEVSEQVGRVHESIQHLVLAQNGGGGKRRGSRFSTAGRLSRGNSFESIESRNAARSPRPSIANFQGGDGAVVVANREEGKLLRHARTMRVNKRARVGMAAASLPIGWPVCIEARGTFASTVLRPDVELQIIAEACQHDHAPQTVTNHQSVNLLLQPHLMPDKDDLKEVQRRGRCVLHPTSAPRFVVDVFSLFVLAYDLLVTPYVLAFDMQGEHEFFMGSLATLIFWTLSVPINLRSGFFKDGEVELRTREILKYYARTWMCPDIFLVSTDWVSMITLMLDSGDEGEGKYTAAFTLLRFSKVGRLLRLLGIFRMARFTVVISRIADWCLSNTAKTMVESLGFVFALLWVNHLISCAWVAIGLNGSNSDTGLGWLDSQILAGSDLGSYRASPEAYKYSTSLHWAITQMSPGSMQVNPLNTIERFFTVVCLVLGILCSGSIVSTLTAKMMQIMMANQDRSKKLQVLRKFLRQKSVSKNIAVQVQKMVLDRLAIGRPLTSDDVPALGLLSLALRAQLQDELCRPQLVLYPFLKVVIQMDGGLVRDMCTLAVDFAVLPVEDNLFLSGSVAAHTYFVVGGVLRYVQTPETSMVQQKVETSIAEGTFICEAALWTVWTHVGTVEANMVTELMRISAAEMVSVLQKNQVIFLLSTDYARSFTSRLQTALPPVADWPSDVSVPFADYGHVVLTMSRESRILIGLLAMDTMKSSLQWRFAWAKVAPQLQIEVNGGEHAFIFSGQDTNGVMERVVSVVSIRVEDDEERALVQVGIWDADSETIEVCCRPIGTNVREGEKITEALRRVLLIQLQPFVKYLKIKCPDQEVIKSDVDRQSVATKYLATTYGGYMGARASNIPSLTLHPESSMTSCFFVLPSDNHGCLMICAWLQEDNADVWRSPPQKAALQSMLDSTFPDQETLEAAKEHTEKMEECLASGWLGSTEEPFSRFDDWVPANMVLGLASGDSMSVESMHMNGDPFSVSKSKNSSCASRSVPSSPVVPADADVVRSREFSSELITAEDVPTHVPEAGSKVCDIDAGDELQENEHFDV